MRYFSHLNTAVKIITAYGGKEPFHYFIKEFFNKEKKFGGKDRKRISHLCYCYFRLGKAAQTASIEEKILGGLFLCNQQPDELLQAVRPDWNENMEASLEDKIPMLDFPFSLNDIFSWRGELSETVDEASFNRSFLQQPDLFLRIRPGHEIPVEQKLEKASIQFQRLGNSAVALANSVKMDSVIELDKEAVVQDYSSQQVGEFLKFVTSNFELSVWDCCAGSGGKSIMAYDILPIINLTVSDIRESSLANLKKRFNRAGIFGYHSFVCDLSTEPSSFNHARTETVHSGGLQPSTRFDLIIADVPCSGSGTWGRNPEQLLFFEKEEINRYTERQKKIVEHAIPALSKRGHFLYITCSVFKKENEDIVHFIQQKFRLRVVQSALLQGYGLRADTFFVALFTASPV